MHSFLLKKKNPILKNEEEQRWVGILTLTIYYG